MVMQLYWAVLIQYFLTLSLAILTTQFFEVFFMSVDNHRQNVSHLLSFLVTCNFSETKLFRPSLLFSDHTR